VFTMAFAIGAISGGHFNPAVTVGLTAAGRFPAREIPAYVAAQLVGAIVASLLLLMIARSMPGFDLGGFATNGYGDASPKG
ncbi:aquaporin, partial [Escherichia coli]|nr:aquaporin [Escherichia coli]